MAVRSHPVAHCRDIRCIAIDKPLDRVQPAQSSTRLPSRFGIEERWPLELPQAATCIRLNLRCGALWILRSGAVVVDFVFAIPLDTRIIGNDMFACAACDAGCTMRLVLSSFAAIQEVHYVRSLLRAVDSAGPGQAYGVRRGRLQQVACFTHRVS